MKRLALMLVSLMIAGAISTTLGCASRQKRFGAPAQAVPADHQPAASTTPVADESAKTDPPAGDPPASAEPPVAGPPAGIDPPGQASVDPPAAQPEIMAGSSEVMGAASANEDLADADILAAQATQAPSGSLAGRAIRAAPGVAKDTVLFPFRFLWKVLRKTYTVEGLTRAQRVEVGGQTVSIADYNKKVSRSGQSASFSERVEDAASKGYDYSEKTVFLPFRIMDSVVGLIFSPF